MAFDGTRMDGNPLCTEPLTVESHSEDIGDIASACIAEGSYLIYVYA